MSEAIKAKHGTALFGIDGAGVRVYDNTNDGIGWVEGRQIAEKAARMPIYWSDDRLCHWMFDFQCFGHWVEGLFHNNGLPEDLDQFEPLHVNVYD